MAGKSIRIFLADGSPTGVRTAEVGLSTIKAVVSPRSELETLQRRPEARCTGVYILAGEDQETPGRQRIYIGEGDEVFRRIKEHNKEESKEFWDRVYLFVAKDDNLTKAHIRHLEAMLIKRAKEAKRSTVQNGTDPDGGRLPEPDLADMDAFLEQLYLLCGTLGLDVFALGRASVTASDGHQATVSQVVQVLHYEGEGFTAVCSVEEGNFVVLANSKARAREAASLQDSAKNLRAAMKASGVLVEKDGYLQFSQDYDFNSATAAAQVVSGTTVNGRAAWRVKDRRTYKEWQEAVLEKGDLAKPPSQSDGEAAAEAFQGATATAASGGP